jgi:Lon protease-like protein
VAVEIPLFPLSVVLFPHMPLSLHVFEGRYRAMMRDCERDGTSFGVVSIREGVEVGGPARPHAVGTLAQLRDVERLEDGRYDLVVTGASRFRVVVTSLRRPYLLGSVEYLEDTRGDAAVLPELAGQVAERFRHYAHALAESGSASLSPDMELPDDPELLSYVVAAGMQVETDRKQRLLEVDSAEERLRECLRLLRREGVLLEQLLARQQPRIASISLN